MAISITGNTLTFEELYRVALSGESHSQHCTMPASTQLDRVVVNLCPRMCSLYQIWM